MKNTNIKAFTTFKSQLNITKSGTDSLAKQLMTYIKEMKIPTVLTGYESMVLMDTSRRYINHKKNDREEIEVYIFNNSSEDFKKILHSRDEIREVVSVTNIIKNSTYLKQLSQKGNVPKNIYTQETLSQIFNHYLKERLYTNILPNSRMNTFTLSMEDTITFVRKNLKLDIFDWSVTIKLSDGKSTTIDSSKEHYQEVENLLKSKKVSEIMYIRRTKQNFPVSFLIHKENNSILNLSSVKG